MCFFSPRPAEGEGFVKRDDIFRRGTAGEKGVKAVRKINPYRLPPLLQTGGAEGKRLPLSLYALAADSSRFVYIIITINFPVEQTSSNGLSLSLTPCPSLLRSARVHITMRGSYYAHHRCSRPIDPIQWREGQKKKNNTTRYYNNNKINESIWSTKSQIRSLSGGGRHSVVVGRYNNMMFYICFSVGVYYIIVYNAHTFTHYLVLLYIYYMQ